MVLNLIYINVPIPSIANFGQARCGAVGRCAFTAVVAEKGAHLFSGKFQLA
jgi:hypothetical protein